MLRILKFLVTGYWHSHVWEDAGRVRETYHVDDQGRQVSELPFKTRQPMKCKICGERKTVTL